LRPTFTIAVLARTLGFPPEKIPCRRQFNRRQKIKVMGDKSPKSNQKKSSQKQAKASSTNHKKAPLAPPSPPPARKNNRPFPAVSSDVKTGETVFLPPVF
jgi:hypothetical protein